MQRRNERDWIEPTELRRSLAKHRRTSRNTWSNNKWTLEANNLARAKFKPATRYASRQFNQWALL